MERHHLFDMNLLEKRSLGFALLITLFFQLFLTFFFSMGSQVPLTVDTHLGNYRDSLFQFPPQGHFKTDYWLGLPQAPQGIHPFSLFVHLPFWIVVTVFYPICSMISLYTAFLLFKMWGFRFFASLLGGILYAWQGSFLSNLLPAHFTPAVLFAFFPLSMYLVHQGIHTQRLLFWAWAGVCSGMMFLYLPDQAFLANGLIGIYSLYSFYKFKNGSDPFQKLKLKRFFAGIFLWALLTCCTALPGIQGVISQNLQISTPQDLASQNQKYEWATQWSFTPEEIIQYFIPGFLGWHNLSEEGPYWGRIGQSSEWITKNEGMRNYMLGINTLGTLSALLAFIGFFGLFSRYQSNQTSHPLRSLTLFFVVLGSLFWILGLGKNTPLYRLFFEIPGMDTWRNPLKFILLPANFCWIVLSVFGAQRLFEVFENKNTEAEILSRYRRITTFLFLCMLLLIPLYLFLTILLPVALPVFQYTPFETSRIIGTILGSILIALTSVGLWMILTRFIEKSDQVRRYPLHNPWIASLRDRLFHSQNTEATWFMGIGLLVMLQMAWIHQHYLIPQDIKRFHQPSAMINFFKLNSNPVRVKLMGRDPLLNEYLNVRLPLNNIACLDIPAASRIPQDYETFFNQLGDLPLRFSEICAVQYWIAPVSEWAQRQNDPRYSLGWGDAHFFGYASEQSQTIQHLPDPHGALYAIIPLKNALTRISWIPNAEFLESDQAILHRLKAPEWNPKKTILLNKNSIPSKESTQPSQNSSSDIKIISYTTQEIRVQVNSPQPGYLLIADRFDPDWVATINEKNSPVLRANYIQRALSVPSGNSEIVIQYKPKTLSVYLQLFSLLILTIVSVRVSRNAHA